MKRFSWVAFFGFVLVEILVTSELYGVDMRHSGLHGGPKPNWFYVGMWAFQPIHMLLWVVGGARGLDNGWLVIDLAWSICVGIACGFLVPRIVRRRR